MKDKSEPSPVKAAWIKLRLCPFCGWTPRFQRVTRNITRWKVRCYNPSCEIQPSTALHNTQMDALSVWEASAAYTPEEPKIFLRAADAVTNSKEEADALHQEYERRRSQSTGRHP